MEIRVQPEVRAAEHLFGTMLLLAALVTLGPAAAFAVEPLPGAGGMAMPEPGLPPLAARAEAWRSSMLHAAPSQPAPAGVVPEAARLPTPALGREPVIADAAKLRSLRLRPSADLPPVAQESALRLRAPWLAPSEAPAYALSPEAARLSWPCAPLTPDPDRAEPASDATQERAQRAMLAVRPELPQKPAPLLRLTLPDPQELITPMRMAKPPADNDGPAASLELPPQPLLPVLPAAKP